MRVHGCLDGNCLFDRLSMPGFVLNPQWDGDCLIDTPVPVVVGSTHMHVGGCLDRNWLSDELSMPDLCSTYMAVFPWGGCPDEDCRIDRLSMPGCVLNPQ